MRLITFFCVSPGIRYSKEIFIQADYVSIGRCVGEHVNRNGTGLGSDNVRAARLSLVALWTVPMLFGITIRSISEKKYDI